MHITCTMPFAMNKHLIIALNYSNHGHGYCRLQAKNSSALLYFLQVDAHTQHKRKICIKNYVTIF